MLRTATLFSLLLATTAMAEVPESVRAEVSRIEAGTPVHDAILEDLSQDGSLEALVILGSECGTAECEWRLIADRKGEAVTVASHVSRDIHIEPTEGNGRVIVADGIIWAYDGVQVFPFADALSSVVGKPALDREIDMIATTTRFTRTEDMDVTLYRADVIGDAREERIFLIGGMYYAEGAWGTPYLIYDADQTLLFEGASADYPRLFPSADRQSLSVVDVVPAGFGISVIDIDKHP